MIRVTCAPTRRKKHRRTIKRASGYYGRRSKCYRVAKQSVEKAMQYSYCHRRTKKRDFRSLWIQRINAAVRLCSCDMSYSVFMGYLLKININLNRKILSEIAIHKPEIFAKIVEQTKLCINAG